MFRFVARGLGLAMLAGLLSGCVGVDVYQVSFNVLSFNDRLRPDIEPLDPAQERDVPTRFSDADQVTRLVSGLYPAAPAIAPADLRGLGFARTLWVPAGTRFVLSYEAVAEGPAFNGRPLALTPGPGLRTVTATPIPKAQRIGLSGRGITDPRTRQWAFYLSDEALVFNNGRIEVDPDETVVLDDGAVRRLIGGSQLFSVVLERCTGGAPRPDPDGLPGTLTEECSRTLITRDLCEGMLGAHSRVPATVVKCMLPAALAPTQDTSYRLLATAPGSATRPLSDVYPGSRMTPMALLNVKVVGAGERVLRRRATAAEEECQMPDGRGGRTVCDRERLARLAQWRMCGGRMPVPPGTRLTCTRLNAFPQGFAEIAGIWNFSVATPDGGFNEQFLDGVGVLRVKLRVEDRTGATIGRYLLAEEVTDLRVVQGQGSGQRCEVAAEPRTGHAVIDPGRCRTALRPLTVAWAQGQRAEPVTWRLIQRVTAEPSVVVGQICPPRSACQNVLATNALTRDLTIRPQDDVTFEFAVGRPGG